MIAVFALVGALAIHTAAGSVVSLIEPYQAAATTGAVGVVSGRALTESLRPGLPDEPVAGVSITLVPRSEALVKNLEEIRRRARVDMDALRTSASAVIEARRAWERALADAGAAELVRYTVVDPDGRFDLKAVPAGDWLVLAEHARFVDKAEPVGSKRDRTVFLLTPRLMGYWVVTFWLQEVGVPAGGLARVEFTDRNSWMTAIEEKRAGR